MHPEVCHIVPFAFNSSTDNLDRTSRFMSSFRVFFPPAPAPTAFNQLLTEGGLGCSDKHWNLLSISPYLHTWWSRPYWALECTGILPHGDGYGDGEGEGDNQKFAVVLVFHWMPHNGRNVPDKKVSMDLASTDCRTMLSNLREGLHYGQGLGPSSAGHVTAIQHDCFRPIVSGQEFKVIMDTAEDAAMMREMVNFQWACVRVAAMSGAAGPQDLDDDFSELDEDRYAFELQEFYKQADSDSNN